MRELLEVGQLAFVHEDILFTHPFTPLPPLTLFTPLRWGSWPLSTRTSSSHTAG